MGMGVLDGEVGGGGAVPISEGRVLGNRKEFEVIGVDAGGVAAFVVDSHALGDRADEEGVGDAVCPMHPLPHTELPIPFPIGVVRP